MAKAPRNETYLSEQLDEYELMAIRSRWTTRGAHSARSPEELADQLADAQRDIGRLLRHLDVFDGPPVMGRRQPSRQRAAGQ